MNTPEELKRIFDECRTIAVVGLSSKPTRASNGVAGFMRSKGYQVIPVNPFESEVFGEESFGKLADVPVGIDLVDIFRRSDAAGHTVDEAVAAGVKAVWMQEGVVDEEAAKRAEEAGLMVVMDRCWLKEWYVYGQ